MRQKLRHMLHTTGSLGADLLVGTQALLCASANLLVLMAKFMPGWSAGCFVSPSTRRSRNMILRKLNLVTGRALVGAFTLVCILTTSQALAATPPGTMIPNAATLNYDVSGSPMPPISDSAFFSLREQAVIEFWKYVSDPSISTDINIPETFYRDSGGSYQALPSGPLPPTTPGLSNPVPLVLTENFHIGEPIYIVLTDRDQNQDPNISETVEIIISSSTGDTEWLRLTETDPASGIFSGYIPSTARTNGQNSADLTVAVNSRLTVTYTDPWDDTPTVVDLALVDPYGIVFDTVTGQPVNGASVTLIDTSSNLPADVLGDDLAPGYPATVISGQTIVHNSITYDVPEGGFRFPFINPGTYKLVVTPPDGYANHTTTQDFAILQQLPGGPFALSDASIGGPFPVNPGPAIHIDVPIDPAQTSLWMQKEVNREEASVGDFLQYTLTLENLSKNATALDVTVTDRLPLGFRYQSGSTHIDGKKTGTPKISKDGRTLRFEVGNVSPQQLATITYVIEVTSGAKLGDATNRTWARDNRGESSNTAAATVEVKPEFFDNSVLLAGRVLSGSCQQDDTEMAGVSDVRLYLEDGTYIVTDEQGRYHFEGIDPGIHVVQLDTSSLPKGYEMLPCEESSQFAGRTFSSFVDLRGGTLWRVNFYTAPKAPETGDISLQMSTKLEGETASFHIDILAKDVPAENLRLTVMLPGNSAYISKSALRDDVFTEEPQVMPGVVTIRMDELTTGETTRVTFRAAIDTTQGGESLPAKATLMFDSPAEKNQRTPLVETSFKLTGEEATEQNEINLHPRFPTLVAKLQDTDRAMLSKMANDIKGQKILRIDIVGHTDNVRIAPRSRKTFKDNYALSLARAESVADFLRENLNLGPEALSTRGLGDSMPIADNGTATGRALNRRVELNIVTEKELQTKQNLSVATATSKRESISTKGINPAGLLDVGKIAREVKIAEPPAITDQWLLDATPEAEFIWPAPGHVPHFPSLKVLLKHKRGHKPALKLNGQDVSPLNLDTAYNHPFGDVSVQSWFGIDLRSGRNRLEATITTATGKFVDKVTHELWYVTETANADILEEESTLIADGIQAPSIAVRFTDENSQPIRPGQVGDYMINPPFQPLLEEKDDTPSGGRNTPQYVIGDDGVALIYLEPTTQTGEVKLHLPTSKGIKEISTWLKPAPRDWILVGFAQGTVGYNTFSGNQVSLKEAGIEEDFYDDGEVKLFAKGAIKGEWLMTMAYDSDKPDLDGDTLHQMIDPDTYYPLYGDGTNQGYEAASASNIYLKIERDKFYALFGDIDTGLTQTEFSRYTRSMNGIKSELKTDTFSYTVFAADTKQAFAKDEIRGDGTSGRYYLSTNDLVTNSEEVVIEVRDRVRSERILEERKLIRHRDYDIDYDAGSLFFKRPIPSKDENFNPTFIVISYETLDSSDLNFNYGGRAAAKLLDGKVEIGASYVHEEKGAGDGDLYGADVTVQLTPQTTLHAEAARTETSYYNDDDSGEAYLAEVTHESNKLKGSGYYREQQQGFGLGQQNGSETGTRKYGAQGSYNVTPQFSLAGLAYHEDNLATDAKRDVAELDGRYTKDNYAVHTGVRGARDQFSDGESQRSNQWLIGGHWTTPDRKLTLRGDYEQSLGNSNENSDYPTLLTLGADYQLTKKVSLFTEQEFSWGEDKETDGTRAGLKATPWQGADLRTTVEQQTGENGQRVFALFGLGQSWQVNERWSVDASIDRSHTIKDAGSRDFNTNVPAAHGANDDFTAVSIGATHRVEKWTWWNRLETRQADNEDKYGISTSIVGEPQDGIAVSAKALAFISEVSDGTKRTDGNIRMGLAYRPTTSRWIILNRLDFYFDKEDHSSTEYDNWRIVNNMHANFRLSRKTQMSFYYGLKYVRDNFNGVSYSGYTDLIAFEARYNINKRWDIGVHGSMLHSWNSNNFDYSAGADVGYSPMTNTWLSLGYNIVGFEDEDFSAANYTAQGAYLRFRAKFDQQSVRDAAEWINK